MERGSRGSLRSIGIASSRVLPTSSAGYWSPIDLVKFNASASEAKNSFGGDFFVCYEALVTGLRKNSPTFPAGTIPLASSETHPTVTGVTEPYPLQPKLCVLHGLRDERVCVRGFARWPSCRGVGAVRAGQRLFRRRCVATKASS